MDLPGVVRVKRSDPDRGITNLDIRDAIFQLLKVIRDGNKKADLHDFRQKKASKDILDSLKSITGSGGIEKKIDNISTFLLRMNNKLDALTKQSGRGSRRATAVLETLAQESYDMLSLLPTYIENTRSAVVELGRETNDKFGQMENIMMDDSNDTNSKSLKKALVATETNILKASTELKDIVIESGHMAESLFERVDSGYKELEEEIKGLANVEQVLLDTADSVMDTKRKIEFGVQQIIFKVTELVQLSGGEMEIMYGQLSNSIGILEKVKSQTEEFTDKNSKNLGSMDNQVEGLTDRMTEVDDNLNYMLGQLSLVVSEFNQVKTGLGEAMEGIGEELLEEYKKQQEVKK